jgi:hypothetical protein
VKNPNLSNMTMLAAILTALFAAGWGILPVQGASQGQTTARQFFEVPLFEGSHSRIEGVLSNKEYSFRLPEHVRLEPGSEIKLAWRGSPLLLPDVSTMSIQLNERDLTGIRLGTKNETSESQEEGHLAIPLASEPLQPGWNRIVVKCLLQTTQSPCRDVDNPASWVKLGSGSVVRVAFSPTTLFPELQRFPQSLAKPALMRLAEFRHAASTQREEPVVSLLIPPAAGEAELRTLLISAARIGQTVYLDPDAVQVKDIAAFPTESIARNGILIGLRSNLSKAPLPPEVEKAISSLGENEGMLAEIITGPAGSQRRWIIVCGADSQGLEKAARNIGE